MLRVTELKMDLDHSEAELHAALARRLGGAVAAAGARAVVWLRAPPAPPGGARPGLARRAARFAAGALVSGSVRHRALLV